VSQVLAISGLLAAGLFAPALPPRIEQWRREIEAVGGGHVVVVEVETSADGREISFPADTAFGNVLRRYFLEEAFVGQFTASHALTINYYGPEGRLHLVLLNLARWGEWGAHREALLGHELGHAWLYVNGFRSPEYAPAAPDGCLAIHAGDIVQHILIRQELKRRGIPFQAYWIQDLERALARLEEEGSRRAQSATPCETAQRLAMWTDVRLGLSREDWEAFGRFDAAMRRTFPDLAGVVEEMVSRLSRIDVGRRTLYRIALDYVTGRLASAAGF